jgi:hypothetical protein
LLINNIINFNDVVFLFALRFLHLRPPEEE